MWGANQRITLEEAIHCGTVNGAYAAFEENLKGSIQPGQLADLIVLDQDPFKTDPSALPRIASNELWSAANGNSKPKQELILRRSGHT